MEWGYISLENLAPDEVIPFGWRSRAIRASGTAAWLPGCASDVGHLPAVVFCL